MVISRTPYRVSFFGGGTDYSPWYREHGGAVLATTINKFAHLHVRPLPPFFAHRSRVVWSKIEQVGRNEEIEHPAVRAALQLLDVEEGVEIHHLGDLPARSGLGSSSAFTVGILNGLLAMRGQTRTPRELAEQAIHIERDVLGENVGVQDQIQTAYGGLNRIDIATDGSFEVHPVVLDQARREDLEAHLLLCFTGVSRTASDIAGAHIAAIADRQTVLHRMRALVDEAERLLTGDAPIAEFGALLHENWQLKKSIATEIAPPFVDEIYGRAMAAGATGGKLMGAGGGGFMVFVVPPERRDAVEAELNDFIKVPIKLHRRGTEIIYHQES